MSNTNVRRLRLYLFNHLSVFVAFGNMRDCGQKKCVSVCVCVYQRLHVCLCSPGSVRSSEARARVDRPRPQVPGRMELKSDSLTWFTRLNSPSLNQSFAPPPAPQPPAFLIGQLHRDTLPLMLPPIGLACTWSLHCGRKPSPGGLTFHMVSNFCWRSSAQVPRSVWMRPAGVSDGELWPSAVWPTQKDTSLLVGTTFVQN